MSHFTEIKTSLKNTEFLKRALKKMGFSLVEAQDGVDVRGFFGDTLKAEFKVLTSTKYDIGFVKNDQGSYELVGDWELLPKVSKIDQAEFLRHLKREYAQESITELAKQNGFELNVSEDAETGQIEMVVSKW